uniref:PLA2c domain-containing protein n=1 Tax=Scleropages formosus TaxID=113540 RepID=A0A8C9VTT7_SCLFO
MRKSVVCYFSFPFRRYVRVAKSLNLKEEEYVKGRQAVVEKFLTFLPVPHSLLQEHVPVIAVLGSGGGERAMVGLLGVLAQIGEKKLLDSITYLCGVSGCTWCMASLYEDPKWSVNVAADKDQILERLSNGKFSILDMLDWLSEAVEDENYSLTDFWAATVVYNIIKEIDRHHLSEQQDRDPTNPYPIYTAIDKGLKEHHQKTSCWFEITPHEAGYSHVGAYVDTSHFGSQFEAGKLKKAIKEEDMLYLQGLCGSAIADGMENITEILHTQQKASVVLISWCLFHKVEHIPAALLSDEKRDLIDAGILLNSPCVALLRPERKVDLILFFDFSRDDPFLTVKKAADYCKEAGIPFPSVVIEPGEEKNPKDFYVFKDETKAPIVIHIPLFNTVNCGGWVIYRPSNPVASHPKDFKNIKEMIEDLLLVSSRNVKNNKEKILNEIKAACAR